MGRTSASLLLAALALGACDGGGLVLLVRLKTDARPGLVFSSVRTDVVGSGPGRCCGPHEADPEGDYLIGVSIAEARGLSPGPHIVRVSLRDAEGQEIVGRGALVTLDRDRAVTIPITIDCAGVTCPGEGQDAHLTECLGGECVPPECVIEAREHCGDPCETDLDCASAVACAEGTCLDGTCFVRADDARCRDGEYCHPSEGCRPRLDADPDAGVDCLAGGACDTGNPCERGVIECVEGAPRCVAEGVLASGTPCRAAVDACDVAEACDGASALCPADASAPVGTACADGICDGLGGCAACTPGAPCGAASPCARGAITCAAEGARCEVTGPAPAGTPCRPAADVCDAPESCDGASTECPADGFRSAIECRGAVGACDRAEQCSGASPACPPDGVRGSGEVCRDAADLCDATERCDGASAGCPGDALALAGTPCRASDGDCDLPEACDGTSAACPSDRFRANSVTCRGVAGDCDVAERCTGSSATCPGDGFRSGVECRPAAGDCDRAESCNGSGPHCPSDGRLGSSTVCRSSAGVCDVAERCAGNVDCPADAVVPNATGCGATFSELSCGPLAAEWCDGGECVRRPGFDGSFRPDCGTLGFLCGFPPGACCGGDGAYFCVSEPGNPIYGGTSDCAQCCRPGRCCLGGDPGGPCL